ncbi:MAG: hypothetical protein ACR2H5_15220 [Ktedonobacteraceae bacterium]
MTRDFNKPGRDDVRPFSRPQPSNRPGEERSPRPARPRLNRETVDRAWESGAPTQHADYRTRSNNGQPPRNSWRNNQQSEHSPAQNGRKPFGNRPDGNRRFDRTPNEGYQDNRSRSFGTDRQQNQFGERRNNDVRGNAGGPNRYGARPGYGDTNTNNRPYGQRPPFREHEQGRGYPQRDTGGNNRAPRSFDRDSRPAPGNERPFRSFDRDSRPTQGGERPFRSFDRDSRPAPSGERPQRSFDRDSRPPRSFDRGSRPTRSFDRGNRQPYNTPQRDTQNPRWQSRPATQHQHAVREQFAEDAPQGHFEGDYERFNTQEQQERRRPPSAGRPFQGKKPVDKPLARPEGEELHVTRLPDGRVLKGSRPAQRRDAQFWTDIAKETENLVEQVATPAVPTEEQGQHEQDEAAQETQPQAQVVPVDVEGVKSAESAEGTVGDAQVPPVKRKPRTRSASSVIREKKPRAKADTTKPRSTGPKPSRRGYKWPTP